MSQDCVKRSSLMIEQSTGTYWHCLTCESLNSPEKDHCTECGHPRWLDTEPASARDTQVAGTHYKDMGVQPWDVVDTWPVEQQIGYYRGNALKYIMRMGTKDDRGQEAGKAKHYIQKLIEVLNSAGKRDRG